MGPFREDVAPVLAGSSEGALRRSSLIDPLTSTVRNRHRSRHPARLGSASKASGSQLARTGHAHDRRASAVLMGCEELTAERLAEVFDDPHPPVRSRTRRSMGVEHQTPSLSGVTAVRSSHQGWGDETFGGTHRSIARPTHWVRHCPAHVVSRLNSSFSKSARSSSKVDADVDGSETT
jgi:hypothetical protein